MADMEENGFSREDIAGFAEDWEDDPDLVYEWLIQHDLLPGDDDEM